MDYALLESPAPRRVLMIGGGVNGSIAEALKHPTVQRIDYVELDPALIVMARQFFPTSPPPVSRTREYICTRGWPLLSQDNRRQFNAILVNVPDPETAQLNRFYTSSSLLRSQSPRSGRIARLPTAIV